MIAWFRKLLTCRSLREQSQNSTSKVFSEENFNADNFPVYEVENQFSGRRIERNGFMVRPVCTPWLWSCVERGAEVITAATPVNEAEPWHLLGQILLIATAEKRG